MPNDYDNIAIVVDWLDACRSGNVDALLDLYAADAGLQSVHEGVAVGGRAQLAAYWAARLATPSAGAFVLEQIMPVADGVVLDHADAAGRLVRTTFSFAHDGRISHSRSEPLPP